MNRPKSGRPLPGEFADYAASLIAYVGGDDAIAALEAQCSEVLDVITKLDDSRVAGLTYAPGKWTFKEVIGHLIDDERSFAYRALWVARNDKRPIAGFEEKDYVAATHFESRTLASLAAEYRIVRQSSIAFFESLTPEEWMRTGTTNGYPASVRGLAYHIAGHELHHLRMLREKYLTS